MEHAAWVKFKQNYRDIQKSHNNPCDIWGATYKITIKECL